ncbi:hypothetical protein [Haloarcula laminariae]|uniref:hypothetical protein n=1 Tax=Haloarcula laminariae TaxID=2961577 RepID=UPI0021C6C1FC|nr:hypothetical protein [Halomicroarcula laminariae]
MVVRRRGLPDSSVYLSRRPEEARVRRMLVLAVVVLAGCSGAFGGDTSSDTPELTPAPVPTASAPELSLPVTADGTPAVGRIIADHRAALSTRDFHRRVVVGGNLSTTDVWVDRDGKRTRVRHVTDTTDEAVVADGRRYERRADGSVRVSPGGWELPYVDSASGRFVLQRHVAGLVYERTDTVTRNGTEMAVLRANTTDSTLSRPGSRTIVAANSTLYVDGNGIVRAMDHRERYAGGTVRTVRFRVWTGEGTAVMPEWFTERET